MKKFAWILLFPFVTVAQNVKKAKPAVIAPSKNKGLVITGNLAGIADTATISLITADDKAKVLAKAKPVKGKFSLTAVLPMANIYLLSVSTPQAVIPLFVAGNEKLSVEGALNNPASIMYKGSATQNDFINYTTAMQPLMQQSNELNQYAAAKGVTDSLKTEFEKVRTQIINNANQFINQKPASLVSAFVLLIIQRFTPSAEYMVQQYNKLAEPVRQSFYGKLVGNAVAGASQQQGADNIAVGSMAADFSQTDTSGAIVNLSSFKGKYVLVDFWASWCRPCRQENPNVVNNFNRFKDKNFTVLGVSLDRAKEPWLQAIKDDSLSWTHVSDLKFWSNAVAQQYGISSIPQNLLIGPDGKIVAKNLRGADLENTLCKFLGCN
jgi:peroxiredoxin